MYREAIGAAKSTACTHMPAGVSHGLDLVCRHLAAPGDTLLLEQPTYFLAQTIFNQNRCVPGTTPSAALLAMTCIVCCQLHVLLALLAPTRCCAAVGKRCVLHPHPFSAAYSMQHTHLHVLATLARSDSCCQCCCCCCCCCHVPG
jgi:hypothetical protein